MRVTVCELSNDPQLLERDWQALIAHARAEKSDFVLLPEMAFHPWLADTRTAEPAAWETSVRAHDRWMGRLGELSTGLVAGTRPLVREDRRYNEGFLWQPGTGYRPAHTKYYLPDEDGFWEASWYDRGAGDFVPSATTQARVGFLICTELWFNFHAREYAREGIHLLLCPRATPGASAEKWIAGGRTAAVVSGAFCLSSNFSGPIPRGGRWAGAGWVIEPEEGRVLGVTSSQDPFLTVEIDLEVSEAAKRTYPRYVRD